MCSQKNYNGCLLFLIILVVLELVHFVISLPFYDNRDLYRIKLDPLRTTFSDLTKHKHVLRAASSLRDHNINNNATTIASSFKKWQVGRVSRKQYEIINMLWRKTKEFVDLDAITNTAHNYNLQQSNIIIAPRFNPALTSTPSFIEFYYLDDSADIFKSTTRKISLPNEEEKYGFRKNNRMKGGLREHPIFTFHVDSNYVPLAIPIKHTRFNDNPKRNIDAFRSDIGLINNPVITNNQFSHPKTAVHEHVKNILSLQLIDKNITASSTSIDIFDNETCPYTTQPASTDETIILSNKSNTVNNVLNSSLDLKYTIAYDRIKFFELYDKNTPVIYDEKSKSMNMDDIDLQLNGKKLNNVHKTLLEHVDQDLETQVGQKIKAKLSKKHIIEMNQNNSINRITVKTTSNYVPLSSVTSKKESNTTSIPLVKFLDTNYTKSTLNLISKVADWPDYSFMAVYIFEPAQVHCDAAGISPHWLVTSGSCLSRHHKNPGGEGRSAFVAYCGSHWWTADRVAYVKYSVVHPSFHQRDTKRRHMYNIGLVQVVISMDTCPGWTPISLMSHRYVTLPEGSVTDALGWGLDRYDTQYSSADLPKNPLMKFQSNLYSDSCPGNYGYLHAKHLHEGGGVKNLYCMLLPPYAGEETDPIHGSMLIVGGKLCAIYLQEERRPKGDQSGIYTGIWRLGPWVSDAAREPEHVEQFRIDI